MKSIKTVFPHTHNCSNSFIHLKARVFTYLMFISILFVNTGVFAQQNPIKCAMQDPGSLPCDGSFSALYDQTTLDAFEPVVLNVYFWELLQDDGTVASGDSYPNWDFEKETLDMIAEYNRVFNPYKIFFKYKGYNSIENNSIYNYNTTNAGFWQELDNLEVNQGITVIDENAINVYVTAKYENSAARDHFSKQFRVTRGVFYDEYHSTNPHEMGHALGLAHTFRGYYGDLTPALPDCEKVSRTPGVGGFNADTHGDRVVDTNAIPDFRDEHRLVLILGFMDQGYTYPDAFALAAHYTEYNYLDVCDYENQDGADCAGDPWIFDEDDIANIMGYARTTCTSLFTIGQMIRIHEGFVMDCQGVYEDVKADYASLYEPYKGEYYDFGPIGENDTPYFQPGFTYFFVYCEGDFVEPATYNETFTYNINGLVKYVSKYETDYNRIFHPNHSAIKIDELNTALGVNQVKACFNNYNKNAGGGKITKFNDNVFNANVTITEQDSTAINNPQLINNLDPGLYAIEKHYEDGAVEQTIILKDNE